MKVSKPAPAIPVVTRPGTPLEDRLDQLGLLVKREDLCCAEPGPASGRMRGVYAHAARLVQGGVKVLCVLDGGRGPDALAVAYAARLLKVACVVYCPALAEPPSPVQLRAAELGAELFPLKAEAAYVSLLHASALADVRSRDGAALMPYNLRLPETTEEVAAEVIRTFEMASRPDYSILAGSAWLVSLGSASVAAGVVSGLNQVFGTAPPPVIIHLSHERAFPGPDLAELCRASAQVRMVDERYAPGQEAKLGPDPDWPADPTTDLKAFRWWDAVGRTAYGRAVFWSVG